MGPHSMRRTRAKSVRRLFFPYWETVVDFLPMKVIGRQVLADSDVNPFAKKRLALMVRQLSDGRFPASSDVKVAFPTMRALGNSRFVLPFAESGLTVEVLANFEHQIICIEKITEQEASE